MKRETYKGRKIKVVAGRGAEWGYTRITLNGVDMGKWMQSEDEALRSTRDTIDHAGQVGINGDRYGAEWYAPGTFELCSEGHVQEIGGECLHSWCIKQRAKVTPIVEETDVQRYDRLSDEMYTLRRIHPDERTQEQRDRLHVVAKELTDLLSIPPAGYSVPKAAADLMEHAKAHGWAALAQWTALGYDGEPFLRVRVGRRVTSEERKDYRGDCWVYELTWHSRDCAPGKVRRFGQGTAVTPDNPAMGSAPSVKAIREVIAAHPRGEAKAA
jgi:hypothetical protein